MKREARFVVDELTNSIREVSSGKIFETEVLRVSAAEIKKVHKKDGWFFNWKTEFKESRKSLYKLSLTGDNAIQGLISLEPVPNQLFIEMHLIETAPHNHPNQKRFAGVAGK